jgi:ribA/ribD-fused uncharacterized protein
MFRGDQWYRSNFYPAKIIIRGQEWETAEHVFQAAKFLDPDTRHLIRVCVTPKFAKQFANEIKDEIRKDWEKVRIDVMYKTLKLKFNQHPNLRLRLKKSTDYIIEDNYWHDNFWGNCTCEKCKDIEGQNWMGKLLMKLRDELREKP